MDVNTIASRAPAPMGHSLPPRSGQSLSRLWRLEPELSFLNHGSYGAVPIEVAEAQAAMRERIERDPVRFYKADLEALMDEMRRAVGRFLNCPASDLAPFSNATHAICTVLNSIAFNPGDEVIVTDHEYMSVINELQRLSGRSGLKVVVAPIPFPIDDQTAVFNSIASRITPRTRLVLFSHITSVTSLIFPAERLVRECERAGIDVFVDATHAPGQIPVDVGAMRPTYWVGSGHKWLSAPKGTGFLYVRPDRQEGFRPLALTSRAHKVREDRPLFLRDFDYMGTDDYSAILALPAAIRFFENLLPGGLPEAMRRNHELILAGRDIVCGRLGARFGISPTCPDGMTGSMVTLLLPEPSAALAGRPTLYDDPLQDAMAANHRVQAPIWRLSSDNRRVIRLSAQVYNTEADFERCADALAEELALEHPMRRAG